MSEKMKFSVCCHCDAFLSCAACGVEQPPCDPSQERDAVIEECAKWHEERAALEINSLHCGDNSATIAGAHRVAVFHKACARDLRLALKEGPR